MHVLITADTLGGVWTYVRELVIGLVRRGVKVTLVSFGEIPLPQQVEWLGAFSEVDFRPTGFHLEWMQDAAESVEASGAYLKSVVDEVKPDLLHLNQYCYGSLDVDVPKVVVAHSDVLSWWDAVHGEEPRETRWLQWYREAVRTGLSGATLVVAPSQSMLDTLPVHYMHPLRSEVIHNGRTPLSFNPYVTKENYAVSVGRLWDGGKNVTLLTQLESPLPIHIAGCTEHPEVKLRSQAQDLPGSNIHMRGQMAEAQLRQLLCRASIYIAPSLYEPFGLAPLEAALSRCALVLNDIPSLHEIWGENACYFRHNDAQDLAQTLQWLASDEEACLNYANLAYQHARHNYDAERMVDRYCKLYKALVRTEARVA